jgi:hypothetical protein
MSDILIGVIIGGLIASITPVLTLIVDHRHWVRDSKLEHLRSERKRLENKYSKNLKMFSKAMGENSYSSDMIMEFILTMPKDISATFKEFMSDPNKTEAKSKKAYINTVLLMKKSLTEIDKKIEDIIFQK